ncbi:SUKH-3 domain-containing protein [Catellatospora sp. NPDC049609]|uniref:SUKH-3 domain-containing protein n=1 Tax=Catellatospora sp. NPDC049609 TaxID=3155505 RepID=UPI00341E65F7
MISQERLQEIVRHWAVTETLRRGYPCEPRLTEFEAGWVVWAPRPAGGPIPEPGSGETVIIDRDTGELTVVPGLPPQVAMSRYASGEGRAATGGVATQFGGPPPMPPLPPMPVPPAVDGPPLPAPPPIAPVSPFGPPPVDPAELARRAEALAAELTRLGGAATTLPQVVAVLEVGGQVFEALGHTADAEPDHHPAVRHALASIAPGNRNRGAHRHPELLALSRALHTLADGAARPDQVAQLLSGATLRLRLLREGTAPAGAAPAASCHTCGTILVSLGMRGELPRDLETPDQPPNPPADADATRAITAEAVTATVAAPGLRHRLPVLPFLVDLLAPYAPFYPVLQSRRGVAQRAESFTVDVWVREHTADTLGEAATRVGARLYPIGGEPAGYHSIIAVDEHRRVFAIDHAGIWFLGPDLAHAVQTLLTGGPTPRLRADGTW